MTLTDLIDKGLFSKYGDKFSESFRLFDKWSGKVDMRKLNKIYAMLDGEHFPYRFIYYMIHGNDSLAGTYMLPQKYRNNQEKLYKKCVINNETWDKYVKIDSGKNILY